MPKKRSRNDTLDAWHDAEKKYRRAIEPYLPKRDREPAVLTTNAAVAITRARTKADHLMEAYLRRCFD